MQNDGWNETTNQISLDCLFPRLNFSGYINVEPCWYNIPHWLFYFVDNLISNKEENGNETSELNGSDG